MAGLWRLQCVSHYIIRPSSVRPVVRMQKDTVSIICCVYVQTCEQTSQNSRSHPKIQGPRWVIWTSFHQEDPYILDTPANFSRYGHLVPTMVCVYIYIYICVCVFTYIYIYIHKYIHTYTHAYIHTCIHTCIHAYTLTHIQTHTHTYIHTCMHTYMHTYKHIMAANFLNKAGEIRRLIKC